MFSKFEVMETTLLALVLAAGPTAAIDQQDIESLNNRLADLEAQVAAYEAADQADADEGGAKTPSAGGDEMHVYGQIRVSVDHRSGDYANTGTSIASNASRFGIAGSSQLDNENVRVIYMVEMQYEAADSVDGNNSKALEFREGFGGLTGEFGTARFGRLTTGYKKSLEVVDPWIDSALESHAGGNQGSSELHGNFFNNPVDLENHLLDGKITTSVWYGTLFSDSAKPLHNTGTLRNYTGVTVGGFGVQFRQGPLFLAVDVVGVDADNITLVGLENGDGWQFSGRYEINQLAFGIFYEDVEELGLGTNIYGNVIYSVGETRYIASYSVNDDAVVYGNNKFRNFNVGLKRSIGATSEIVAAFNRNTDTTNNLDFDNFTIGLNTSFGN